MKKTYELMDLECAHCAAKMQAAIEKLDGVQSVAISFLQQKMVIEAEDGKFDAVMKEAAAIIQKIEPDCEIIWK